MSHQGLSLGLETRLGQELHLAPRMLQSIQVLELPTLELEAWLTEQAQSNEALELDPPSVVEAGPRGSREATEAHDQMLRNQPDRRLSLCSLVETQLATADLPAELEEWVRFLVGCLDPRGHLSTPDEVLLEFARTQGLPGGAAQLGAAIAALQGLDPRGIGARDAIEALLLQLDPKDPDYAELCRLLEEFLEELALNRLPAVATAMGLEMADLQRLLSILSELDPRPAAELAQEAAPTITPELEVRLGEDGGWEVELMRGALPSVRVDPLVGELARDGRSSADVRRYLRGKLDRARWVVDAVAQRGATLLRVAEAVFARQRDYLRHGPGHLVPLTMTAVAEELDLHVSTISRSVAGKHVQTPWETLPMRELFQAAAGEGQQSVRRDVRELVRQVFDEEDKASPLSDDEAVQEIEQRGVKIARRTVAKYRKELGIPSSYRRREFPGG